MFSDNEKIVGYDKVWICACLRGGEDNDMMGGLVVDEMWLRQTLMNLVGNVYQFTLPRKHMVVLTNHLLYYV